MVNYDACAEHLFQPPCELRRQGYFGHEHQHVAAGGQRLGDQVDVDFGLARTGDSVQEHRAAARGELRTHRLQGLPLVRRGLGQQEARIVRTSGRPRPLRKHDTPFRFEAPQHRTRRFEQPRRHLAAERIAGRIGDREQRRILLRRTACEPLEEFVQTRSVAKPGCKRREALGARPEGLARELLLRAAARLEQRGQRHAHHLAQGAHIIIGDPLPQRTSVRIDERSAVKASGHGLHRAGLGPAIVDAPDDSRVYPALAERHRHRFALGQHRILRHREGVGRLGQRKYDVGIAHGRRKNAGNPPAASSPPVEIISCPVSAFR